MALAANALTLLATLKTELGETTSSYDAVLERLINVASDAIENYCNRNFSYLSIVDERVKGWGTQRIFLARTPVVTLTSVVFEGATVDSTAYYLEDPDTGVLFREGGWEWSAAPQVYVTIPGQLPGTEEGIYLATYEGGYITPNQVGTRTLPFDLEEACIATAVQAWRNRGKYQNLQTESQAQEDATWRGHLIPGPYRHVLKKYRRVTV